MSNQAEPTVSDPPIRLTGPAAWDEMLNTLAFVHRRGREVGEIARAAGFRAEDVSCITLHGAGPADAYPILTFGDWHSAHYFQVTPLETGEVTIRQRLGDDITQLIGLLDQASPDPDLEPSGGTAGHGVTAGGILYDVEDAEETDNDEINEHNLGWENPSAQLRLHPGEDDEEPSLGSSIAEPGLSQQRWAQGNTESLEIECEDEGGACEDEGAQDEREPDAGDVVPTYADEFAQTHIAGPFGTRLAVAP